MFTLNNSKIQKNAIGLIHKIYITFMKNKRKYTASTKTRSEVRGGGKKPWRQKGTGKARAGSIRSPLWVGGGVIFGPKPKFIKKKINTKERNLAIISALNLKKQEGKIKTFDENLSYFDSKLKTKSFIDLYLNPLGLSKLDKVLFVLTKSSKFFWQASKNIKNVTITTIKTLNIEDILKAKYIVISNQILK